MKLVKLKYKKYSFPFPKYLTNQKQNKLIKEVIIIQGIDDKGSIHYGEIAPLMNFSKETILECEKVLSRIINENAFLDYDLVNEQRINLIKYPSVLYGLEQLFFDKIKSISLVEQNQNKIYTNALIGAVDMGQTLDEVQSYVDSGFNTIKLKIGRESFENDLDIIKSIQKKFGSKLKLRLDVNGKWNYSEACVNFEKLQNFNIEYIEQPVQNTKDLLSLNSQNDIEIAIDESVSSFQNAIDIINTKNVNFLILKPSIRIGFNDTVKIIDQANKSGVKIIITSAYETHIGRFGLLYLASLVNHNYPHGLNTPIIGSEYITSKIRFDKPSININQFDMLRNIEIIK